MYANRTTFAATTAVMAAKVELPRMQRVRRGRVIRVGDLQGRTIPYVLLRCEIRSNRDDGERQTEDDELEKYSLAVNEAVKNVCEERKCWIVSYPSSMVCPEVCAETPRALILS